MPWPVFRMLTGELAEEKKGNGDDVRYVEGDGGEGDEGVEGLG